MPPIPHFSRKEANQEAWRRYPYKLDAILNAFIEGAQWQAQKSAALETEARQKETG